MKERKHPAEMLNLGFIIDSTVYPWYAYKGDRFAPTEYYLCNTDLESQHLCFEKQSLFQLGDFLLHSGDKSKWKIDCNALTDSDLEALALMLNQKFIFEFGRVEGIPRGGLRLAKAMEKYITPSAMHVLIVDDVFTTGSSFHNHVKKMQGIWPGLFRGAVLFARNHVKENWIVPLFNMR